MSSLAIIVPTLGRPHAIGPLLNSIERATPWPVRVLFIPDPDDHEVRRTIRQAGAEELPVAGGYAAKINRGIAATDEQLLFMGADDLNFHPGWFEAATEKLTDGIGVVGTNDLGNPRVKRGKHATHSLITRDYAELGTIDGEVGPMYEGYHHWKVDDELVATAKHRNAWAFAFESIVEHQHPYWDKGEMDDTYRKGEAHRHEDTALFRERSALWT